MSVISCYNLVLLLSLLLNLLDYYNYVLNLSNYYFYYTCAIFIIIIKPVCEHINVIKPKYYLLLLLNVFNIYYCY